MSDNGPFGAAELFKFGADENSRQTPVLMNAVLPLLQVMARLAYAYKDYFIFNHPKAGAN